MVNNLPAKQETQEIQVQSLGLEDPLEEEMATHSDILVWEIPWTEEPGGLQPRGHKESDRTVQAQHSRNCRLKGGAWAELRGLEVLLP